MRWDPFVANIDRWALGPCAAQKEDWGGPGEKRPGRRRHHPGPWALARIVAHGRRARRGGWAGRLIDGDELLLATQRRLASADRTEWMNARREERKAVRQKRRDRAEEPDEAEDPGAPDEEDLDEPAAADLAEAA